MNIYSGKCLMGRCGLETNIKDALHNELFVGDIVALVNDYGFMGLTAIVEDGIETYSDGNILIPEGSTEKFVMGIKSVNIGEDDGWWIVRSKPHYCVVDGENWPEYGFNYKDD